MSSDTPSDERGTDAEITTFQVHSEPSGDGRVAVEVKPPDLVTLAITSSDHGSLPGGTQSHAILTVGQAESLVDELEEAIENTDADRHPPE